MYTLSLASDVEITAAVQTGNPYAGGRASNDAGYDLWFTTYQTTTSPDQAAVVVRPGNGFVGMGVEYPAFR